ncbi:hypothetical protein D3C72_1687230 [compost metagenome]
MLAQAVPLEQADHGQRQQDDQRQVARLDEGGADRGEDLHQRHRRGQPGGQRGEYHDQHGIEAQHEADNDDADPDKGPEIDCLFHKRHQTSVTEASGRQPCQRTTAPAAVDAGG